MDVFIALYRGINVGGKNIVKMEALRAFHEKLGHKDVKSYIQSGNMIFSAKGTSEAIAKKTADEFEKTFGFPARIAVLDAKRLKTILDGNPYAKVAAEIPKTVHAGICEGDPDGAALKALLAKTKGTEKFVTGKGILYLHAPDGFGTSKFALAMEKASGVPMTVRNWNTMATLWEMINEKV